MIVLTVVIYLLIAACSVFAYLTGTPFHVGTFAIACLAGIARAVLTLYLLDREGQLPKQPRGTIPVGIIISGFWMFVEIALAFVLAVFGIHTVCMHESVGHVVVGLAFAAFPAGLIQPWRPLVPKDAEE